MKRRSLETEPTDHDLERLGEVLRRVGGGNVSWGAQSVLDLWIVEKRAELDEEMSRRIGVASWALVFATVGLVLCTAGLIWATILA
ncbi:hypothetical protein [Microbacterium sp. CCH5-D1]|uniref:hypothetical protein n=1 Tax=Microbacterium sp. CCH5-D1 TaxID=1768780 RepID=UPI000ACA93C8|nr:hypothetical protein [Microbacterium sp. CCH5-D1]